MAEKTATTTPNTEPHHRLTSEETGEGGPATADPNCHTVERTQDPRQERRDRSDTGEGEKPATHRTRWTGPVTQVVEEPHRPAS